MKKQMLFTAFIGFFAISSLGAQQDAFKINVFESDVRRDMSNGISSTNELNGVDIWKLLDNQKKINPKGISIVEYLGDNKFSDSKELDEFSQKGLASCDFHLALHGYKHVKGVYLPHYVSLTKSLRDGTCYLCINDDGQTIVTHAQGTPQKVCDMVMKNKKEKQRLAAIDKKFQANISRPWRQAEKEKKQAS